MSSITRMPSPKGTNRENLFLLRGRTMAHDAASAAEGDENVQALIDWAKENLDDDGLRRLAMAAREAAGMSEDDEQEREVKGKFPKNFIERQKSASDARSFEQRFPNANRLKRC